MVRNKKSGVSLIELLFAITILVFVLTGLLVLFINCLFLNASCRNLATALSHAQYIVEEIRGTTFSEIESKINHNDWDLDTDELSGIAYNFSTLPNENINTETFQSGNPLGVSVGVTWKDRNQRNRNTELRTLITNY
ncbi:MAG: prepilin-type N-terminal cleavage/methylation domain-containing protein [Candidatus Omnitrophica bacterium]|nr:prepilin-type N-terminal cleavage/methylation domain-containing protein [Candidatus Omnitrophota bacterium]